MSLPFKRRSTRPIPDGAKLTTRRGKQTARWIDGKGAHTAPVIVVESGKYRGERRVLIESAGYYGQFSDGDGRCKRIALGSDFDAAKSKLDKLVKRGEREREGVDSIAERHERESIDEYLKDYRRMLLTTGNSGKRGRRKRKPASPNYVDQTLKRIERIVSGCRITRLVDINADATDEFIGELAAEGLGAVTLNGYLEALDSFVQWCIRRKCLTENRLADVHWFQIGDDDIRHERRALTPDEAQRLIDAAVRRPVARAKFYVGSKADRATHEDRVRTGFRNGLGWKMLICTGVRRNELRGVRWADVDLEHGWLVVRAEVAKTGKRRDVALRSDLVTDLMRWRELCEDVRPEAVAVPLMRQTARAIRADLKFAGVAYRDDDGKFADVHSLRHTTNTWLRKAGVEDFIIKLHLGHSTKGKKRDMTEGYTDPKLIDMHAAVERLPALTIQAEASRKDRAVG